MKTKAEKPEPASSKRTIELTAKDHREFTRDFVSPEFHATLTETYTSAKAVGDDRKCLREDLIRACDEVNAGDMRLPERMALAQAHTLNHLFNRLTQRAFDNLGGTWFEPYMRLALRAQTQSARTLETLAALKSPAIFAKQLNVANQQLVSNGSGAPPQIAGAPEALREPVSIVPLAEMKIPARAHERMDR